MQARQRFERGVLSAQFGSARLERRRIRCGPPITQLSFSIQRAALVVKSVREFVSDNDADHAVVDRIVRRGVEIGRLQDRGVKDDVSKDSVVGINRLRCQAPVGSIHRAGAAIDVEIPIRGSGTPHITDQVIAPDLNSRIVARVIRITDLDGVGIEFFKRFDPGFRTHPLHSLQPAAKGRSYICYQLLNLGFRFRRKLMFDIDLSYRPIQSAEAGTWLPYTVAAGYRSKRALPARLHLRLTRKHLVAKGESRLLKWLREISCCTVCHIEGLPGTQCR